LLVIERKHQRFFAGERPEDASAAYDKIVMAAVIQGSLADGHTPGRQGWGSSAYDAAQSKEFEGMNKFLFTVALGASLISAGAAAQQPGGGRGGMMMRDQTRAEAQQRADMMFQMIDSNHDGTVTKAEAQQALTQFQAMRGGDDSGRGAGRMQRMIDEAFGTAQSLTQAQFEQQMLARFDSADLNHDGTVTAAEREQARAQAGVPAPAPANPQ
jgi:hypothetical protein